MEKFVNLSPENGEIYFENLHRIGTDSIPQLTAAEKLFGSIIYIGYIVLFAYIFDDIVKNGQLFNRYKK